MQQRTLFGGIAKTTKSGDEKKKKTKTKNIKNENGTENANNTNNNKKGFDYCPMCGRMQHETCLEEHVNACLDARERQQQEQQRRMGEVDEKVSMDGGKRKMEERVPISSSEDAARRRETGEDEDDKHEKETKKMKTTNAAVVAANAFQKIKQGSIEMSKTSSPSFIYGHKVIENFITEEEEEELLRAIYDASEQTWNDRNASGNGHHNGKAWGVNADRARRKVFKAKREMPEAFQRIVLEKLRANDYGYKGLKEFGFACNECNAIEYIREQGHELRPHVDDRILSSDIIINLSMVGSCIMRYRMNKNQGIEIAKDLPRFSLQIQGGKCRFEWEHGIRNEDLIDGKRVSLTFRCSGRGNGKDGVYKDVVFEEAPKGYVNDLEGRERR
jgi:alkylated DNA repair dioxygenase AlkB